MTLRNRLIGLAARCDHVWLPSSIVRGWAFEVCARCNTRRVAP